MINQRRMRLPKNAAYPNFNEHHWEDEWCSRCGCVPVCEPHGPVSENFVVHEYGPSGYVKPQIDPLREAFERECQAGIARKDPAWLYVAKTFNFTLPLEAGQKQGNQPKKESAQ